MSPPVKWVQQSPRDWPEDLGFLLIEKGEGRAEANAAAVLGTGARPRGAAVGPPASRFLSSIFIISCSPLKSNGLGGFVFNTHLTLPTWISQVLNPVGNWLPSQPSLPDPRERSWKSLLSIFSPVLLNQHHPGWEASTGVWLAASPPPSCLSTPETWT